MMGIWYTTAHDMMPDADGFEQNTAIEARQQGICGDVAGNGVTGGVILLSNYIEYSGYSRTKRGDAEESRKPHTIKCTERLTVRDSVSTCLRPRISKSRMSIGDSIFGFSDAYGLLCRTGRKLPNENK